MIVWLFNRFPLLSVPLAGRRVGAVEIYEHTEITTPLIIHIGRSHIAQLSTQIVMELVIDEAVGAKLFLR